MEVENESVWADGKGDTIRGVADDSTLFEGFDPGFGDFGGGFDRRCRDASQRFQHDEGGDVMVERCDGIDAMREHSKVRRVKKTRFVSFLLLLLARSTRNQGRSSFAPKTR